MNSGVAKTVLAKVCAHVVLDTEEDWSAFVTCLHALLFEVYACVRLASADEGDAHLKVFIIEVVAFRFADVSIPVSNKLATCLQASVHTSILQSWLKNKTCIATLSQF